MILAADGSMFAFGQLKFIGSAAGSVMPSPPFTGIVAQDGGGPASYWDVLGNGKIIPIGAAQRYGDASNRRLNAPLVGVASTSDGKGYWLLGADGGVINQGDALYYGSMGVQALNNPVTGGADLDWPGLLPGGC